MKNKFKKLISLFAFLSIYAINSYAQTDTEFWFVAPRATNYHEGGYKVRLKISSFGNPSDVTISIPKNEPMGWPMTEHVNADSMIVVDLTLYKPFLENWPFDRILQNGLHITATNPVTVYYEIGDKLNGEIFTLKGVNALGTKFYTPAALSYHVDNPNEQSWYNWDAWAGIDVVATEDNTTVKIKVASDADTTLGIPDVVKWTKNQLKQAQGTCQPVYKWTRVQQTLQRGTICTGPQNYQGCLYNEILWTFADTSIGYSPNNYAAPTTWESTVRSDTVWKHLKKDFKFWTPGGVESPNYGPYRTETKVLISSAFTGTVWQITDTMYSNRQTQPPANDPSWISVGTSDTTWFIDKKSCNGYTVNSINQPNPTINKIILIPGKPAGPKYHTGDTITVILNRGESYNVRAYSKMEGQHLAGTLITSDKPIAVTVNEDTESIGACQDIIGDQIIPVNITGLEYIAVIGETSNGEDIVLVGTQPSTNITYYDINGTQQTMTLNDGQVKEIKVIGSGANTGKGIYIKADKPIYVYQITSISTCEAGSAMLPPIVCTGSRQVAFSRTQVGSFAMVMLTKATNKAGFTYTLAGSSPVVIPDTLFKVVPGTNNEWVAARVTFANRQIPINKQCVVKNSLGVFHLGISNGYPVCSVAGCSNLCTTSNGVQDTCVSTPSYSGTGTFGYFSNFNVGASGKSTVSIPKYASCEATIGVKHGAAYYHWYDENNNPIPAYEGKDTITFPITDPVNPVKKMVVYPNDDCGGVDSITFIVKPTKPIAGFDKELCASGTDSVRMEFDPKVCLIPSARFKWFNGDSLHTAVYAKNAGIFKVYFWDGKCLADSGVFKVKYFPVPNLKLPNDTTVCNGNPVKVFNLKTNPKEYTYIYKWSTGEATDTITPSTLTSATETKSFILTITNGCKESVSDTMKITILHNKAAKSSLNYASCSVSLEVEAGKKTYYWYQWQNNLWTKIDSAKNSIEVMKPVDSVMAVSSAGVCNDTNYYSIKYTKPIAGFDKDLCGTGADSIRLAFNPATCLIPTATFKWFNGNTTDTVQYVKVSGTYNVYFWDGKCLADSGVFKVKYYPKPLIKLPNDTIVCNGSPVLIHNLLTNPAGMTYLWSTDENTESINPSTISAATETKTFILTITNKCNESVSDTMKITIMHNLETQSQKHFASCAVELKVDMTGKKFIKWYSIANNVKTLIDTANSVISVMKPVNYVMAVSSAGVCNDTSYFNIEYTTPKAGFAKDICATGLDSVKLDFDVNQYYTKYKWLDSIYGDSIHPVKYIKQAGKYKLFFFDGDCIAAPGLFDVKYFEKPKINPLTDATLCPDKTVTLDAGQQDEMKYLWNTKNMDTIPSITIVFGENANMGINNYLIKVTNRCKQDTSASVNITYQNCEITIPNIMTPNGDGVNDYFWIKDVDKYDWEVIIYNRWGNKIYENSKYLNEPGRSWTADGVAAGVYYYVAHCKEKNITKHGWVEVVK